MTRIARLDVSEWTRVRSGMVVPDFGVGVRQLLVNSLEGDASSVELRVDASTLSVFCRDNGVGIGKTELLLIGRDGCSVGKGSDHRGESLYLLLKMSRLTIISRFQNSSETNVSDFNLDVMAYSGELHREGIFGVDEEMFSSHGTVVIASNMFHNIPVRRTQLLLLPRYKLEHQLREAILEAIMNLNLHLYQDLEVSFSMKVSTVDYEKKLVPFITLGPKDTSLEGVFLNVFGLASSFIGFKTTSEAIEIEGIVSQSFAQSKTYQYVFLDGKRVDLPYAIRKDINRIFDGISFDQSRTPSPSPVKGGYLTSGKPYLKFPVFLIKCNSESGAVSYSCQSEGFFRTICEEMKKIAFSYGHRVQVSPRKRTPVNLELPIRKKARTQQHQLDTSNTNDISVEGKFMLGKTHLRCCCPLVNEASRTQTELVERLSSYQIPKDGLQNLEFRIIRQIDKKFIMLSMLIPRESDGKKVPVLVMLDQHACDERVHVETLFKEIIECILDPSVSIASRLDCLVQFEVALSQSGMFDCYKPNFAQFGIKYNVDRIHNNIIVTHLPSMLMNRDSSFLKHSLLQHCYDLDMHYKLARFDLDPKDWFRGIVHLPRVIIDAVNSKACRSAIMFGDLLDNREIHHLVQSLSKCHLPFQCAHGRPSVIPLVELSST